MQIIADKELVSRMCKELPKLNNKKTSDKRWAKYLTRHFAKGGRWIANKQIKRGTRLICTLPSVFQLKQGPAGGAGEQGAGQ